MHSKASHIQSCHAMQLNVAIYDKKELYADIINVCF